MYLNFQFQFQAANSSPDSYKDNSVEELKSLISGITTSLDDVQTELEQQKAIQNEQQELIERQANEIKKLKRAIDFYGIQTKTVPDIKCKIDEFKFNPF